MPEITETFETYVERIAKVLPQMDKPIIISTDVRIPSLKAGEIKRVPIAWPLYKYSHSMVYIVTVPPKTHIPGHSHDEDILRIVMKGSLILASPELDEQREIREGMWFVVRRHVKYEIKTESGYETIAFYSHICLLPGAEGTHWVEG